VYYIPYLPFHLRGVDFAIVTVTAILISFVSTLYPALRASHINPAEALRYE
jgi:lipoprotein-releasing system permease protein